MLTVNFALLWGIPMDACSFIEPPELTVMHHCVFWNLVDRQSFQMLVVF